MQQQDRIQNIQALRGVAVLFVVFLHLFSVERKYGGLETILPDILQFGIFGVDMFFVISGFVMVTVTRGKFRNFRHAVTFIYRRLSRIYPLYWVYTLLVLVVFLIQPSWVNSKQGNHISILESFLLIPSHYLPLVMVGWTLIHEIYFYTVFSLALLFSSEKRLPFVLVGWGGIVVLGSVLFTVTLPTLRILFHPLTLEFIGGCFLAILYQKRNFTVKPAILVVLALAALVASVSGYYLFTVVTGRIEPLYWWRVFIFGIPALAIVFCLINAERNGYLMNRYLIRVGDASYSIYLSHILSLSLVGRIWGTFSVNGLADNMVVLPLALVFVIIVGMASYSLVEKPLLRISRKLI
ncbi:putative acyltransferase [Desulfocapsa sulfexigens DSM 10523]|uniref:Putative acyltransferase n=1 Tax=Desulfocapsa sulfexigens (strain DSM 10523 / SB164P1) TaxID=1167006 RepID=M1PGA6_DESSD|nr:acyltransferase [Desulfocapsa sulfexigens]AGF78690.1 putative acyltransferase [Desulfocapsa sulfexigens DSM 10523]